MKQYVLAAGIGYILLYTLPLHTLQLVRTVSTSTFRTPVSPSLFLTLNPFKVKTTAHKPEFKKPLFSTDQLICVSHAAEPVLPMNKALFAATMGTDYKKVAALVTPSVDFTQTDELGNTVLHHAAQQGKHEMLRLFLRHAPTSCLNRANNNGFTPLMLAISQKRYGPIGLLLSAGIDIFQVPEGACQNAFEYAKKYPEILLFLHKRGYFTLGSQIKGQICPLSQEELENILSMARIQVEVQKSFFGALETGECGKLQELWQSYPAEIQQFLLTTTNDYGETPFLRSVTLGYMPIAQFLLEQGSDRKARNYAGESAVDIAKCCHNEPMLWLLAIKPVKNSSK